MVGMVLSGGASVSNESGSTVGWGVRYDAMNGGKLQRAESR